MAFDRASLEAAAARGEPLRFLFFWGHTPAAEGPGKWCFSQWWGGHPFTVDGQRYATAEHFMMAEKARLMGDDETRAAVLSAKSPAEAKALGRAVKPWDEARWVEARLQIVSRGNLAKFGQHAELRALLLGTGDQILVEASPRDRIWGIGLAESSEDAQHPARWRGLNLLGEALMRAREALRIPRAG